MPAPRQPSAAAAAVKAGSIEPAWSTGSGNPFLDFQGSGGLANLGPQVCTPFTAQLWHGSRTDRQRARLSDHWLPRLHLLHGSQVLVFGALLAVDQPPWQDACAALLPHEVNMCPGHQIPAAADNLSASCRQLQQHLQRQPQQSSQGRVLAMSRLLRALALACPGLGWHPLATMACLQVSISCQKRCTMVYVLPGVRLLPLQC